jgi:hypothetical protein
MSHIGCVCVPDGDPLPHQLDLDCPVHGAEAAQRQMFPDAFADRGSYADEGASAQDGADA